MTLEQLARLEAQKEVLKDLIKQLQNEPDPDNYEWEPYRVYLQERECEEDTNNPEALIKRVEGSITLGKQYLQKLREHNRNRA